LLRNGGYRGARLSRERRRAMIQVELTYEDVDMLREILPNQPSELRMEIS
jgi:hypothetical protein